MSSLKLHNKIYRKAMTVLFKMQCRMRRAAFQMMGQIDIHPSAVIEPRARLQITDRSSLENVVQIGRGSIIKSDAYLCPRSGFIKIGAKCSINPFCVILGYGGVTIGNNVRIAAHTSIIAFNHNFNDPDTPIAKQGNNFKGVVIEDDVWIGTGVRILDGVTIGRGSVIAAGAVVNRDIPAYSVAAGVPAIVKKSRNQANEAA